MLLGLDMNEIENKKKTVGTFSSPSAVVYFHF